MSLGITIINGGFAADKVKVKNLVRLSKESFPWLYGNKYGIATTHIARVIKDMEI